MNHGQWYGHAAPNDQRFQLNRPFEHGRFSLAGPSHRYSIQRFDLTTRRIWLPGGFGFEIAPSDWPFVTDWCWTCGDNFVVYTDPDHLGWYMIYNLATHQYVHALYLGL